MREMLRGDIARTADTNWLRTYSILYDVMVSNKSWGKGWRCRDICGNGVWLSEQLLCVLQPCCPESGWTPLCWSGGILDARLTLICVCFSYKNCRYLHPAAFPSYFHPRCYWGSGEWETGCASVSQLAVVNLLHLGIENSHKPRL